MEVIKVNKDKNIATIRVDRDLTEENYRELKEHVAVLLAEGWNNIILNFYRVDYINSLGISAIASILKQLKQHNGTIKITNINFKVKEIFDIVRFSSIIDIYVSEDDALKSYGLAKKEHPLHKFRFLFNEANTGLGKIQVYIGKINPARKCIIETCGETKIYIPAVGYWFKPNVLPLEQDGTLYTLKPAVPINVYEEKIFPIHRTFEYYFETNDPGEYQYKFFITSLDGTEFWLGVHGYNSFADNWSITLGNK